MNNIFIDYQRGIELGRLAIQKHGLGTQWYAWHGMVWLDWAYEEALAWLLQIIVTVAVEEEVAK